MTQGDSDNIVTLFDGDGKQTWATRVGDRARAALVGETSSGEIVATSWSLDFVPTTHYLDGATGAERRRLMGLAPAGGLPFFGGSDPTLDLSGRRVTSRLFIDRAEAVYRVDPATGQRRLLVQGQPGAPPSVIGF